MYKKKILDQTWVKTGQIQAQNLFFCHFLKFGSLVFFEIAYNDRGHKLGSQIWAIWAKIGPKISFL